MPIYKKLTDRRPTWIPAEHPVKSAPRSIGQTVAEIFGRIRFLIIGQTTGVDDKILNGRNDDGSGTIVTSTAVPSCHRCEHAARRLECLLIKVEVLYWNGHGGCQISCAVGDNGRLV